ncbi:MULTISPECIES: glutaredoxin 3 [Paracoccus]|uniref:Glutaredoxin n=1 Tax=Paracoccus aerius TaxID=1915382 RepID=A0ABS1S2A8_9RHOB|nr:MULTISPECIES: glutaredoxin 3 [Paracoccus]MBL3672859.1 glutaredoxin 3 [Paracoccus aerius]QIR84202.1 glutaredoxin 3 [Paracoccus sp. AK26]GHG15795.1 glutaredoxin 3 [Paracoccus aerius]
MTQPTITIYTTRTCPFCIRAKGLLREKNAQYDEIDVGGDPSVRAQMTQRAHGRRTVPQIFIGDRHVGGCDDLFDLERQGKLDALLTGTAA